MKSKCLVPLILVMKALYKKAVEIARFDSIESIRMKLLLSIPLIVSALAVEAAAGGDAGKRHVPIFKCQLSNVQRSF